MTAASEPLQKSTFSIPRMDCPSEENMIRLALEGIQGLRSLSFDLEERTLVATHAGSTGELLARLEPLKLGARLADSRPAGAAAAAAAASEALAPPDDAAEARLLWTLLAINAAMFLVELVVGFLAESTGLVSDSLDMFADAAVYGLALFAVGRAATLKARAAHAAGWLQLALGIGALGEVVRRSLGGSEPASAWMIGMGLVALAANATCLLLVAKKRNAGAHMRASYIFSANDVIANAGVIVAGVLVWLTGSPYPDLVIGTVVGSIVIHGAVRILRLR